MDRHQGSGRGDGVRSHGRCILGALIALSLAGAAAGVETNTKLEGYRGIWFNLGQENEWGPKYSGGLGTYTANHVPIAIYAPAVDKTFFTYGGVDTTSGDLLIMASWYDHATCTVPRPTVVYHKVGINDPHDNGSLLIDRDGYLWIFISGRASARPGFIYRSTQPYSTDAFEHVLTDQRTYPQPWYLDDGVNPPLFLHMFTKYTAGRELYWATSPDGVYWSPHQKMVGFAGHYQTSMERNGKIATAFNYHPGGSVDRRTNLYYMQTTDRGQTWTTVNGTPLTTPLSQVNNPALVVNYEAQGLLCYINDTNLDADGNPYILYITSANYAAGPGGDPRTWRLARWNGQAWVYSVVTVSDHNYDVGNLYIEGDTLRIIGPTENGPQVYGTGGEVAMWLSNDKGATWTKVRDITTGSRYNHSYTRRPRHARDPFYVYWADGDAFVKTTSRLYFSNRAGTHVWRLPLTMSGETAHPERVTDFSIDEEANAPVWRSRFEAHGAGAVADGQTVLAVRNAAGPNGVPAGAAPFTYAAYGQAQAGSAPSPGAGTFAVSLPDDRSNAINTMIPSNAGNLQNAVTFEGFFRTPESSAVTSPTFVARRLVSQKRSADDGSSRLAIGLHGTSLSGTGGLVSYEGFNYAGTALVGQSGGLGWNGPWVDPTTNAFTTPNLSGDGFSLNSTAFPFTPEGSRFSAQNGHISRPLSQPVNLGNDGTTWISALMRKTSIAAGSSENLELGLATSATVAQTSSTIRIGMTSGDQFFLHNSNAPQGAVSANVTYMIIVKIISSAGSPDRCFMNVYAPGDTLPTQDPGEDPANWTLTYSLTSSALLTHLKLTVGSMLNKGEVDEIRVGTTYAAVTDPDAPLATGGGPANVLSVFWHDTGAVNHLELGTTPVLPDTWYHFALTYDGADLRWYLDGNLEGEVAAPNLTVAGSASLTIANNRNGMEDRGFFGLLDQVRISDQARGPAEFIINGGGCDTSCNASGVLWCSGFEAESAAPVTHGMPESMLCRGIENEHGGGGSAAGAALTYVAYGQPGVGDAFALPAGGFALAFPDNRAGAIDTGIPSDTGNLADALTFEGFFNSGTTGAITSPSSVGRRLVSQKRSALGSESRLAIGLHGAAGGGHNVLAVFWSGADQVNHTELGTTPVQPGTWYHFAVVYRLGTLRWYLNGTLQGELTGIALAAPGSAPIVIGNGRAGDVPDRGFYGIIDEVRIVDQALPPIAFLVSYGEQVEEPCHPGCAFPFADADLDGDIDQSDFGAFQACVGFGPLAPDCVCFDRNGDDSVSTDDFAEFLQCAGGPAILWSHGLTPSCAP